MITLAGYVHPESPYHTCMLKWTFHTLLGARWRARSDQLRLIYRPRAAQVVVALAYSATLVDPAGSSVTSVFFQKSVFDTAVNAPLNVWRWFKSFSHFTPYFSCSQNSLLYIVAYIRFPFVLKICTCVSVNCWPFVQIISHLKHPQSEQRRHSWSS